MKKTILFFGLGNSNWAGGLYYTRNILYMITQNKDIKQRYNIIVVTNKDNYELFSMFIEDATIIMLKERLRLIAFFYRAIGKIFNTVIDFQVLEIIYRYNISYIYGLTNCKKYFLCKSSYIYWIPDFQHKYLKNFFSKKELKVRDKQFMQIAKTHEKLILSSQSAYLDYTKFYPNHKKNVFVIPFVSFINNELGLLNQVIETQILTKFNLVRSKYVYIPNQFWQHKNHMLVLKAINLLKKSGKASDISFVFTGNLVDYRNKALFCQLRRYIDNKKMNRIVKILGFIDRTEQLAIMKNAKFIIQPSLFEGWGTVLEDAKILDKAVVLSDIAIHREQKYEKCFLFNPYSVKELAKLVYKLYTYNDIEDNLERGQQRMLNDVERYSKAFLDMLLE